MSQESKQEGEGTSKPSTIDICLKKCETWVNFDPRNTIEVDENHNQLQVTVEHRAWVCPFCEQSTEYWLVNGCVVIGCGKSSLWENGKQSDCCDSFACREKQREFHAKK